jgi:hypothetical protein
VNNRESRPQLDGRNTSPWEYQFPLRKTYAPIYPCANCFYYTSKEIEATMGKTPTSR